MIGGEGVHPNLSCRKPQQLQLVRARATISELVNQEPPQQAPPSNQFAITKRGPGNTRHKNCREYLTKS